MAKRDDELIKNETEPQGYNSLGVPVDMPRPAIWNGGIPGTAEGMIPDKAPGGGGTIEKAVTDAIDRGDYDNLSKQYAGMANDYMSKAEGMGSFSYDFNSDPIFKVLSASYMQQARDAASDASAMAAARTGGYGNSYGAAAATQQYNRALGDLYDQVPELQQAAYNRWNNDRNALLEQSDRYRALSNDAYNKAQDARQWESYEDETAYNRAQDAKQWEKYEDETTYNREKEAKQWERDVANEEWQKKLQEATTAAQMGNYELLEKLLGVSMKNADSADRINQFLQIASLVGENNIGILLDILGSNVDGFEFTTGNEFLDAMLNAFGKARKTSTFPAAGSLGLNVQGAIPADTIAAIASGKFSDYGIPDVVTTDDIEVMQPDTNKGSGGGGNDNSGGGSYTGKGSYSGGGGYVPQASVPGSDNGGGVVNVQEYQIPDSFVNAWWKLGIK